MANDSLMVEARTVPGLRIVSSADLTIRRRSGPRGFFYVNGDGRRVADAQTLERIRSLAVPPAYEDVRIAPDGKAHLQAIGSDAVGRLQYRYHLDWAIIRETRKGARLAQLCAALPRIRQAVARDLRRSGVGRERVLAAVVTLIDRTHIRIGCEDYVHSGRSRGAATLLKKNVRRQNGTFILAFRGKGGRTVETSVKARGLARLYPMLLKLPRPRLFQYKDETGSIRRVTSAQVNAYLTEIAGTSVSAKDLRTLAATALAAKMLSATKPARSLRARRSQIHCAMARVAERLCNTSTVVRKSYVHQRLIDAFESGELLKLARRSAGQKALRQPEAIVAALFPCGEAIAREAG